MKSILAAVVLLSLAGCNPPQARQMEAVQPADPAPAPPVEVAAATPAIDCDHIAALFDMLVEKKAGGWTEADALADISERGEHAFGGPLVDGVFGIRFGPGGGAMARHDTLKACRRMAEGGELY